MGPSIISVGVRYVQLPQIWRDKTEAAFTDKFDDWTQGG